MALHRRDVISLLGGAVTGLFAGCSAKPGTATRSPTSEPPSTIPTTDTRTPTETRTKTDTPEPASAETPTPEPIATETWTTDTLDGVVEALWLPNAPRKPNTTGGPLYAGTGNGEIANLHVGDGIIRWRFSVAGALAAGGHPTLAQFGSDLFVVSDTRNDETLLNHLERVDPETGSRVWLFETREFLKPLGVVDDQLLVAGHSIKAPPHELGVNQDPAGEGRLHAIDMATGEQRWETVIPYLSRATVARHGIYLTTDWEGDDSPEDTLVAVDLDGTERWRKATGTVHLAEPASVPNGVITGYRRDGVSMLAPDGTEQWHVSGWDRGPGQVEVAQDRIYVGSDPLVAIDRNGSEQWRQSVSGRVVRSSPEDRMLDGLILETGRSVTALTYESGAIRWTWTPDTANHVRVKAKIGARPVVTTGIGRTHDLIVLEESHGEPAGTVSTPMVHYSVESVASRLFVGSANTVYGYVIE